ncbi:hypothetical protein VTL71DRAFT_2009 [Oculimacula yallundae]|uniref:C2H2-type domain-containing protein n=1 Tax=Oculimacula yallundae TaxID=86028 RepID=A0ABR4CCA3_9HELO
MCLIRQRCSVCEQVFDRSLKLCHSENTQHVAATSDKQAKSTTREDEWCHAIGIICYECSKKNEWQDSPTFDKTWQAGAWKRSLKAGLNTWKNAEQEEETELPEESKGKGKKGKNGKTGKKTKDEKVSAGSFSVDVRKVE